MARCLHTWECLDDVGSAVCFVFRCSGCRSVVLLTFDDGLGMCADVLYAGVGFSPDHVLDLAGLLMEHVARSAARPVSSTARKRSRRRVARSA